MSLCYTSAPEGVYINVLIGGLANGRIRFWSSWDLALLCELPSPSSLSSPVLRYAVVAPPVIPCYMYHCVKILTMHNNYMIKSCFVLSRTLT